MWWFPRQNPILGLIIRPLGSSSELGFQMNKPVLPTWSGYAGRTVFTVQNAPVKRVGACPTGAGPVLAVLAKCLGRQERSSTAAAYRWPTGCMRTAKHTVDLVRRGSLEVCGIVSCGPCDRREIGDELDGHVCQSGQDLMKVFADRDAKPAAALDHGEDRGHTRSGLFAADVDPVFSAQRYAAHGVFRQVVAKFQFRIFEEAGQFLP